MKNIVILNPDQMRWDYMTPAGHPFVETKHLSRLAEMGTYFSHAFTACPMCGPARASFFTGRYPAEHGVRNYHGSMHPEHPNVMQVLRDAGYHRALFGKDHLISGDAIGVLYDEGEDICIGNMDNHPDYRRSWDSGPLEKNCEWDLTERLTTGGIAYMERRAATGEPFFLTVNVQDPHPYFTCPEPYASLFSADQFELPPNFRVEPDALEPERLTHWRVHSRSLEATELDFKKAMAMYCGQIRYVDDQLGRILDALERLEILDDTIVLFWSDHGDYLADFGVTHKQTTFYDCLTRVPLILWDPTGAVASGRNDEMVEAMDVMAAALDAAGLEQPRGSRAYSVARPDYEPRRDVYAEGGLYIQTVNEAHPGLNLRAPHPPSQFGPGAMLRTKKWKLCLHSFDRGELYDMENDPHECRNLYDDPDRASVVAEMTLRLTRRQLCMGQAPEHLPSANCVGAAPDGAAVWDRDYTDIVLAQGPLPQPPKPPAAGEVTEMKRMKDEG